MHRWVRAGVAAVAAGVAVVGLAACGSSKKDTGGSGGSSSSASSSSSTPKSVGAVSVLYAGSLVDLMEHDLGPKFAKADGASYSGYGAGSTQIAQEITGKQRQGDVFISASPKVNATLVGDKNGSWVSWYATFAQSPLMIGYNPKSKFAADLKSKPWYKVIQESGIRVGRTDPKLDPKGKLTVTAIADAAKLYQDPGLVAASDKFTVFPEETLVGRLESGQLDAGFFYSVEASDAKFPTIGLGAVKEKATYTVTVLNHAKNPAAALAFVTYLLGPDGTAVLKSHALTVVKPSLTGVRSTVPPAVTALAGG